MKKFIKLIFTKGYKQILSFVVPAFYIFLIWYKMGIFYSTNDDRCITEMLAGLVTSHNESHLIYINYLLGLPLAFLYKLTPTIPWFGIFLIALYYISYVFILKGFYSRSKNIIEDVISTAVISCVALSSLYLVGQITYTSIAVLAAIAGYCVLLLHTKKKFGLIYFIVLESFAYLLRDQSMLMIQPLGLSVLCMYIFISENSTFKKNIVNCMKIIGIIVSIIVISFVGNKLGYMGKGWNHYNQFNDSRTILCDYAEFPAYKDVKDILDKYNVTQKTYEGFCSYTILDWDIPLECYDELANYASQNVSTKSTLSESFETYSTILFKSQTTYYNITDLLIIAFIITTIYIVITRKFKALLPLTGLVISQAVVWIYLIYRGRLPHRVTIPLLVSEILLLFTILYLTHTQTTFRKYISLVRVVILLLMLGLFCKKSYTSYQIQHKEIKNTNTVEAIFIESLTNITDYCNHNPDNRYILDTMSLRWYYGSALQTNIFEARNYTFAGGWFSNTPCFIEKNKAYLSDTSNGFYYIISQDDEIEVLEHPSILYLAEKSSSEPIISDTFTASHGGIYYVIYFDGELKLNTQP